MENSINVYKELNSIQDVIVELQKRVQVVCDKTLHGDNFIVSASFKVALMSAMCEMNEAMSRFEF